MGTKFSLIVNCFNRRDYVIDALKSACEQTLPRSEYEIILIKNFHDEKIDNFTEHNSINNIYTDKITTGSWFEIAANNCKGDFVSFLDDDDLFRPDKLSIIKSIIQFDSRIAYIHNKSTRTDSNLKLTEFDRNKIVNITPYDRSSFRLALKNKYYFNLSSITIRSDLLKDLISFIRNTNHGTDFVIFSAAYISRRKMVQYEDDLTYYRVHLNSHGNYKAKSIEDFENLKRPILFSFINNWQLISEFGDVGALGEYAKLRLLTTKIWLNLISPNLVYKIGFTEIIDRIRRADLYPPFMPFVAGYAMDRTFHMATRKIYYMILYSWLGWRLRENI